MEVEMEFGVLVELSFEHEFSNMLNVYVTVKDKGQLKECTAWISKLPSVSLPLFNKLYTLLLSSNPMSFVMQAFLLVNSFTV